MGRKRKNPLSLKERLGRSEIRLDKAKRALAEAEKELELALKDWYKVWEEVEKPNETPT